MNKKQTIIALCVAILLSTALAFQCSSERRKTTEIERQLKESKTETATVEQKWLSSKEESEKQIKAITEEYEGKLKSLTRERDSLKKSVYKERLRIVKPDGSVVEKEIERSDEESAREVMQEVQQEYAKKLSELDEKYKQESQQKIAEISQDYKKQLDRSEQERTKIEELYKQSTKTVKRLRTEAGMELDKDYYGHLSYSLSPFVIGGGVSIDNRHVNDARLGVGLEW